MWGLLWSMGLWNEPDEEVDAKRVRRDIILSFKFCTRTGTKNINTYYTKIITMYMTCCAYMYLVIRNTYKKILKNTFYFQLY